MFDEYTYIHTNLVIMDKREEIYKRLLIRTIDYRIDTSSLISLSLSTV